MTQDLRPPAAMPQPMPPSLAKDGAIVPKPARQCSPWLSIWYAPRATIRDIVDGHNPARFLPLTMLLLCFDYASSWKRQTCHPLVLAQGAEERLREFESLLLYFLIDYAGLLCLLFLMSWLLRVTGKWLGGQATEAGIRRALVWPAALYLPYLLYQTMHLVQSKTEWLPFEYDLALIQHSGTMIAPLFFIFLWTLVVAVCCLAEVQRFSCWKALLQLCLIVLLPSLVWHRSCLSYVVIDQRWLHSPFDPGLPFWVPVKFLALPL